MRERGDLAALTFLWEIVGLFPTPNGDESSSARAGTSYPPRQNRTCWERRPRSMGSIWMILTKVVRFLT